MNNKRATKRALLTSVMALVMCVVMLVGTTFAWFTDTASTGVNKIVAGNLDVDIIGETSNDHVTTLNFTKANAATDAGATEAVLWEPGCRYLTEGFRIANKGNLALKWKAVVNKGTTAANEGNFDLLDVIDFYLVTSKDVDDMGTPLAEFTGSLKKTETSDVYYIKGVMDKNAGNDYQGLTLDGITITVYATQDTVENDSFGPDYDKNATYYPVLDAAGMKDALVNGGNIKVDANVDVGGDVLTVTKKTTIDMNGKTIKNTADIWTGDGSDGNWSLISARNGANLTITGNGTFKAKENDAFAVDVQDGSTVTIENGTFIGNMHAVYVYDGTAVIEGGFFDIQQKSNIAGKEYEFVLNCYDANRDAGSAEIIVKGGTFVNFNPADCKAEGEHTNFVPAGYSVISETKANGDVWYTVVKGTGVTAGTQEALKDALTNADTTSNALTVKLAGGEYTLYNVDRAKTQNTELTIEGAGKDKTVFTAGDMTVTDANGEGSSDYSYEGSDVTFKNMTVNVGTGNYKGFVRAKSLYFENCTIEGRGSYWGIGTVVFKNCTFASVERDYNMWAYAGMEFTFENCTFNSDAGKFINAYKTQHTNTTKLTFTDCKFVAGTENKPAVCLKGYESNAWDVTFSGCSLTNCKTDATTGSNYYLLDQGIENATTVTIDGKVVWENGAKK